MAAKRRVRLARSIGGVRLVGNTPAVYPSAPGGWGFAAGPLQSGSDKKDLLRVLTHPVVKDLVLIGGGHAHLAVLKRFGMQPLPGVRLTLLSRSSQSPYSGMLPGLIAGHYTVDEMHFDLRALADFAQARFLLVEVIGLDLAAQRVICRDRSPVEFDLLSINAGSTPSLADLVASSVQLTPVKPIDEFNARWLAMKTRILAASRALKIGVVGGGAGGVELVLAIRHRLLRELAAAGGSATLHEFHLFTATDEILPSHNRRTRETFARVLASQGIQVHVGQRIVRVDENTAHALSGARFPLDEVLWVTSAASAPWFAAAGIAVNSAGYIRVGADLRSVSHPSVFAVGDCAAIDGAPRPKSGVYAVRQGPPLAENLRRACLGEPPRPYHPQRDALSLISTGAQHAVASRGAWQISGAWVWRWKDWIDRRFMRKYQQLPVMSVAVPDAPPAALARELAALGPLAMRCGGCGAKVGAEIIAEALRDLPAQPREDIVLGLGGRDDAAVTALPPGRLAVHTIDGFRAFISDPYVFGQITAAHCLSDIFAMGAQPQSALAYVTLPLAAPALLRRDLSQLLTGASAVFEREGTMLVGGHTSEGAELSLAFAINGHVGREQFKPKDALQAGDALILTKPLGTGVLLAGAMRRLAQSAWLDTALEHMIATNGPAARAVQPFEVHAMTDVTGFGLAGHLREMLRRGGLRAALTLADLPVLAGATELIETGVRSTLHHQNERLEDSLMIVDQSAYPARFPLLFDPQTSGGLLIALPAQQAGACLEALRAAGCRAAAVIGTVLTAP